MLCASKLHCTVGRFKSTGGCSSVGSWTTKSAEYFLPETGAASQDLFRNRPKEDRRGNVKDIRA